MTVNSGAGEDAELRLVDRVRSAPADACGMKPCRAKLNCASRVHERLAMLARHVE
jgi:hypothetical protein